MAGTYTDPAYVTSQPWNQPAYNPVRGRSSLEAYPPGRGWVQAVGSSQPGALAGLGLVSVDKELSVGAYAAGSLLGATIGGAMVGYVASATTKGATTGALFTAGLAGLTDSVLFGKSQQPVPAMVMFVAGLGSMGAALYRMSRKMGRSRR